MKNKFLKGMLMIGVISTLLSFELPENWFIAGSDPKSYEMGIDKGAGKDGKNTATIKSIDKKVNGFGTLMQQCKPGKYLGKRVRMSGFVKSENVTSWAGLWLRVDQAGSQESLSFDNMGERAIKGTSPWTRYEIVLDVPDHASRIAYGALLSGTGQIWFDNITFEIVDHTVPITASKNTALIGALSEPTNLDFEK